MKIISIRIMRGPNYWSNYRKKLIVLKVDLEEYKELLTSQIKNFVKHLQELIPSLYEHRCSLGVEGGFFRALAHRNTFRSCLRAHCS